MTIDLPQTTEDATIQLQEIYETVNILAGAVEALNDDLQRLHSESISHQYARDPLTQDFSILKLSIQEHSTFLDGVKIDQEILQQDLVSMEQKVNDMKTSSYDGTFIWKIMNVQEKIGQQFMFCSVERIPVFL
jgi:chromosome segregation ATPase